MAASNQILIDCGTLTTTAPTAATKALAIAAAGPIGDFVGNALAVQIKAQEADVLLNKIKSVTASGDSANLALINGVLAALEHTSTPSTAVITDVTTVYTNNVASMNATTKANAIAAAGPIMDYVGNVSLVRRCLQEMFDLLGGSTLKGMKQVTDASDPNLAVINSLLLVLV